MLSHRSLFSLILEYNPFLYLHLFPVILLVILFYHIGGVLIGKRGQTLDSLQYLASLVVNKEAENYIRVKVDTENYRQRRKETLENLAKNIAYKVKRTKRSVSLEPMNPYERRIIHSAFFFLSSTFPIHNKSIMDGMGIKMGQCPFSRFRPIDLVYNLNQWPDGFVKSGSGYGYYSCQEPIGFAKLHESALRICF